MLVYTSALRWILLLAVRVIVWAFSSLVKKENESPTIVLHFRQLKHKGPAIVSSLVSDVLELAELDPLSAAFDASAPPLELILLENGLQV